MNEMLKWNAVAQTVEEGIRSGATVVHDNGGRPSVAAVPWRLFHEALNYHRPGTVGMASAYPHPGFYVQTACGWIFVVADERIDGNVGFVRDACTGTCCRVDFGDR